MNVFSGAFFYAIGVLSVLWPMLSFANPCNAHNPCSEYLVKFSDRAADKKIGALLRREGLVPVDFFDRSQVYHLAGDSRQARESVLRRLKANGAVVYAEPNYRVQSTSVPNDPMFSEL